MEEISTVYRRGPQCGGKFLQSKEEILSEGGNFYSVHILSEGEIFYSVKKRSSVWGKISTVYRRDPQCGGKFLQCTEEILSVGEISTVYRRDPQCGGKFLQCKEEILSVGGNFYSVQKRSSVWGNTV